MEKTKEEAPAYLDNGDEAHPPHNYNSITLIGLVVKKQLINNRLLLKIKVCRGVENEGGDREYDYLDVALYGILFTRAGNKQINLGDSVMVTGEVRSLRPYFIEAKSFQVMNSNKGKETK